MQKKLGRPKLPAGQQRARLIMFRLLPAEEKKIHAAIRRSGLTRSAWVRQALLAAAARQ